MAEFDVPQQPIICSPSRTPRGTGSCRKARSRSSFPGIDVPLDEPSDAQKVEGIDVFQR